MPDRPIDEVRADYGDTRSPEERLLAKRRLGSFYLADVQALIDQRDRLQAVAQAAADLRAEAKSPTRNSFDVEDYEEALDNALALIHPPSQEER